MTPPPSPSSTALWGSYQSRYSNSFTSRITNWVSDLLGPTTVHLQHEAYLLLSLTLLTVASFQNVYREAFGLKGDIIFCSLAALWLSRYIILRWLVFDTSTNANPTIRGVLAHWISSHIVAGQYFGRPSSQVLAKQGVMAFRADDDSRAAVLSAFILPSILYTWQLFRVRILFPLQKFRDKITNGHKRKSNAAIISNNKQRTSDGSNQYNPTSSRKKGGSRDNGHVLHPSLNKVVVLWNKFCSAAGPFLQVAIPLVPAVYYTWTLAPLTDPLTDPFVSSKSLSSDQGADSETTRPFGAYRTMQRPAWSEVFFYMSVTFILSVLYYSRLILPIPDLVAGGNVLKAVRNEAKTLGTTSKSSKSKMQKENQDAPWPEQNKSVVNQNRLRLFATVGLLRIIENLYICCIFPWTAYACSATGHCPEGIQLWQLSKILFPAGITTAYRSDGVVRNDFAINADRWAELVTCLSVIAVSGVLFLAQAVNLNGHYLATMGYITGGWTLIDTKKDSSFSSVGATPSQWDPRRRYKKGDMIVANRPLIFGGGQAIYKATSNSPEGRPFDVFLRATHDLFRNELGHPSTSMVLSTAIQGFLLFIGVNAILALLTAVFWGSYSNGLLTTLVANLLACYGALNVGLTDHTELQQLSQEIAAMK